MEKVFYWTACIAIVEALCIGILVWRLKVIKTKLYAMSLKEKRLQYLLKAYSIQQNHILNNRLLITQKNNLKINYDEEIKRFCTYEGNIKQLYIDLMQIHFPLISYFENEYPSLKRNDIVIIVLIAIGFDNQEISAIFNYTKRTIYKKRQFLSHKIGISSLQLNDYIRNMAQNL